MADLFQLAPKVELHLHLEGAIPRGALWALVQAYGDPETPTLEAMTARFEYRDFAHFIETWQWMLPYIRTPHDWTAIAEAVGRLIEAGIRVSLFIAPERAQLQAAHDVGAPVVELHTGAYADADGLEQAAELERLREACVFGHGLGLQINAGHGLNLANVQRVAGLPHMTELNIGHAIVARALFVGMKEAVAEMRRAMRGG